jgi:hypothetical protein
MMPLLYDPEAAGKELGVDARTARRMAEKHRLGVRIVSQDGLRLRRLFLTKDDIKKLKKVRSSVRHKKSKSEERN